MIYVDAVATINTPLSKPLEQCYIWRNNATHFCHLNHNEDTLNDIVLLSESTFLSQVSSLYELSTRICSLPLEYRVSTILFNFLLPWWLLSMITSLRFWIKMWYPNHLCGWTMWLSMFHFIHKGDQNQFSWIILKKIK